MSANNIRSSDINTQSPRLALGLGSKSALQHITPRSTQDYQRSPAVLGIALFKPCLSVLLTTAQPDTHCGLHVGSCLP